MRMEEKVENNIISWGEEIEKYKNRAKRYLSYRVYKKNFIYITGYENNIEFDYVEIILDQVTDKITLDLFSINGDEKIIDVLWKKSMFFTIIANILKTEEE